MGRPRKHPALSDLEDKLEANGVKANPISVATAILGVVRDMDRKNISAALTEWIQQLAVDVASTTKRAS
jgi:hypothetical protein